MIYMTTDEWKEITALITAQDLDKLVSEIAIRTWDLNISQEELEARVTDTKKINKKESPTAEKQTENDLELRLSPNITIQNGGLECIIEFEDQDFKFEFEQPISHVVQLAKTEKGFHKKENN